MLNIAPALYGQSEKYIRVWLYIFTQLSKGVNTLTVSSLLEENNISRQSLYEILNRGVASFNQNGIVLSLHRNHATDRYIVFNIGQSIIQPTSIVYQQTNQQPTNNQRTTKVEQPKKDKSINDQQSLAINAIVTYLNEVTGKHYRTDNATTIRLIIARLNNGFTIEQFKYVIDVKAAHWMNDEMEKYLRPETLFGNKFESYLNETFTTNKPNNTVRNAEESINRDW